MTSKLQIPFPRYNFDHPDAFDLELMIDVLRKLKEGRKVEVPVYNFVTHAREPTTVSEKKFFLLGFAEKKIKGSFFALYCFVPSGTI